MKNSWISRYLPYILALILGVSLGYFVSGLVFYKIPVNTPQHNIYRKIESKNRLNNYDIAQIIIKNNIFDISTGKNKSATAESERKAKVVSSINGYRLVGFVSGKDPMAIFKRPGKPVAIVTKKKGIDGVWLLDAINRDGVYLKNKKTKEVKKFEFPRITTQLSIFGKKLNITYNKTSTLSPGVERIVVSKGILNKISNINALFKQINIVPVFRNGKAFGYKVNYIAGNSVLKKIGLRMGDIIVSINGEPTTSPNKIMNLYSQIKNMTSVSMDIIRNGVKKTIFVDIK